MLLLTPRSDHPDDIARATYKALPFSKLWKKKKPYTAVTVQIERLTSEQFEPDDYSGIVDLIEVVRLQSTGPTEAARAVRKKLKYGNVHRQLRGLTILDGLIQNAGSRFQRTFADEPLLERLRVAATDALSDQEVKAKCSVLFKQWAVAYKDTPGLERIASLYKELPKKKKPLNQEQSKVLRETGNETEPEGNQRGHRASVSGGGAPLQSLRSPTSPTSPSSSSSSKQQTVPPTPTQLGPPVQAVTKYDENGKKIKSKGSKTPKPPTPTKAGKIVKPFDIEKEKPQILQVIASSSIASINLTNAMKLIDREKGRVSEDPEVVKRFEHCKALRRQILRYIQLVEGEQWLGSLIHANEELINALIAYEALDKSVDNDSDSEEDEWDDDAPTASNTNVPRQVQDDFAGLKFGEKAPAQPPRLGSLPTPSGKGKEKDDESEEEGIEEEDENDPFADRNAISTPRIEKSSMEF